MTFIKKHLFNLLVFLILCFAVFIRVCMLGNSDFQQDEVRVLGFMFDNQPFLKFLFTPSVGPGEFVIAKFFSVVRPDFVDMHLWLRLPFAVAGILSIGLLFFIINKFFSFRLYSMGFLFFCLSGYMIAFSRMLQYQALLIFFLLVSLFFIFKYNENENTVNLIYSGVSSSVALLFHYDSIPVILAFFVFLLAKSIISKKYKILLYFVLPLLLSGLFYIPYILTDNFWHKIYPYILNRSLTSKESIDPLFFSINLFLIYHPYEILFSILIGGTLFLYSKNQILGTVLILSLVLRYINYSYNLWLVVVSIVIFIIFLSKNIYYAVSQKDITNLFLIELWFYFTFLFYGLLFKEPFTHIYTFLIPLFLLASRQFEFLPYKKVIFTALFIGFITFDYKLFINNNYYPWRNDGYIYGKMWKKSDNLKLKIGKDLGFGFGLPYNRNWRDVQEYFDQNNISSDLFYYSNDKDRTARFYLNDYNKIDNHKKADILVCVDYPYSLVDCPESNGEVLADFENSHVILNSATIEQ